MIENLACYDMLFVKLNNGFIWNIIDTQNKRVLKIDIPSKAARMLKLTESSVMNIIEILS